MFETRGRDNFIGRITAKIEISDLPADRKTNGPGLNA
jgi:hypothetical protein